MIQVASRRHRRLWGRSAFIWVTRATNKTYDRPRTERATQDRAACLSSFSELCLLLGCGRTGTSSRYSPPSGQDKTNDPAGKSQDPAELAVRTEKLCPRTRRKWLHLRACAGMPCLLLPSS